MWYFYLAIKILIISYIDRFYLNCYLFIFSCMSAALMASALTQSSTSLLLRVQQAVICVCFWRKLAKKRKETLSSTRQEMTVMVNSMDKSYAEQGTSCDEAISFMDTHNLNGRCESLSITPQSFQTLNRIWCVFELSMNMNEIWHLESVCPAHLLHSANQNAARIWPHPPASLHLISDS